MILCEKVDFAFIHIPKCAGTTVREGLEQLDDSWVSLFSQMKEHPQHRNVFDVSGFGYADLHHPPLQLLRDHFPQALDILSQCRSATIVRDPHERLLSSFAEHEKAYGTGPVQYLGEQKFVERLETLLARVGEELGRASILPFELIHFQPQRDFIWLGQEAIAQVIFPISRMDRFESFVAEHLRGREIRLASFAQASRNRSIAYRNDVVRKAFEVANPVISRIRPFVPSSVLSLSRRALHRKRDERFGHFAQSEMVRSFVQRHYTQDMEIWTKASRDYVD